MAWLAACPIRINGQLAFDPGDVVPDELVDDDIVPGDAVVVDWTYTPVSWTVCDVTL